MATTPIQIPQQQSSGMSPDAYMQALQAQAAQQANVTGLTQVGTDVSGAQAPAQRQFPDQQQMSNQRFGPGEGAARRRESMQNLVKSAQNLASQFGEMKQAREQRQYQQVIGRFTGAQHGMAQAQAQVMQGQQMQQQAIDALKQNPQDAQARQTLQQATQMIQGGSSALKQNQTILNDLASDHKSHKVIMKAFGIDDKNSNSPERQAAIKALQDQSRESMQVQSGGFTIPAQQTPMGNTPAQQITPGQTQTVQGPPGLGQQAAGIMAQLPQTMQLSPQAQAQQMARQAGVVGAPATQGQLLAAETQMQKTGMTEAGKTARASARDQLTAALNGQKYNEQNQLVPMTQQEISENPVLSAKVGLQQARQQLAQAQTQLTQMRTTALPEQIRFQEARIASMQGNLLMRQKEFSIKVAEEERKQLETSAKLGLAESITTPEGGTVDLEGLTGGRPLQSWAQQTVVQTQDRLSQVNALMAKLEPLKDNNQAGYLASDRLGYSMGFGGENGELAAEISNIELQRVVNASTILKGSSRAWAALSAAMIHTPNAWVDSPKLMYQKLQTIQSNLQDMQNDAVRYGQKGQRAGEFPTTPQTKNTQKKKTDSSGFDPQADFHPIK